MKAPRATIWHNPRCGNSRGALQLLREHGIEPEVVDYLTQPPDRATLLRVAKRKRLTPNGGWPWRTTRRCVKRCWPIRS